MSDDPSKVSMVEGDIPEITSLDDLIGKDELAERLGLRPATLSLMRFGTPRLPYLRFGRHIWFSKTQVVWFLNQYQRTVPDPYYVDRMRRLRAGLPVGRGRTRSKSVSKS